MHTGEHSPTFGICNKTFTNSDNMKNICLNTPEIVPIPYVTHTITAMENTKPNHVVVVRKQYLQHTHLRTT